MNTVTIDAVSCQLKFDSIQAWCNENVGPGWPYVEVTTSPSALEEFQQSSKLWRITRRLGKVNFTFKHDYHATLFALRWA